MAGSIYKRCGCKVPMLDDGGNPVHDAAGRVRRRELGTSCPKLRRPGGRWNHRHGTWWWLLQIPTSPDQPRQHLRQGGHQTSDDAEDAMRHVEDLLALADQAEDPDHCRADITTLIRTALRKKEPLPDPEHLRKKISIGRPVETDTTVGEWLTSWLETKRDIAPNTRRFYEANIRLYLLPHLGHRRLDRLRAAHVHAMFTAIEENNQLIEEENAARHAVERARKRAWEKRNLKGCQAARRKLRAMPPFRRTAGPATVHGIRATLRAALTDAANEQLVIVNVAKLVKLPGSKRPKPKIWTPERVARWRATGERPSSVMVWTGELTAQFLASSAIHPLRVLYWLIVHTGLRRGEACGVRWVDLDLGSATLSVSQQIVQLGWATHTGPPKSDAGQRVIALDPATVALLAEHRRQQRKERLAHSPGWIDTGLVFTDTDGSPLHPAHVTDQFQSLVERHGLPPVRLHDLRHGAATHALAAGVDARVVKETLGHSSSTFTRDTYQSVVDELKHRAAAALAEVFVQAGNTLRKNDIGD
ncbi:site-specific integrase [Streptacidiphilus pinicola]|uniref:Site-specific integrase n=1 Tax=Streptacidiphilus pinicola TaxID=2219663 RepID=A0A2X0K3G8_9ACTN|nr:tyrosine-type recombinase/integrase [Streptacidiphilus pinicola]RAG83815.1 site-specific integrase [Streptacidiphilus pinicola]